MGQRVYASLASDMYRVKGGRNVIHGEFEEGMVKDIEGREDHGVVDTRRPKGKLRGSERRE